MRIGVGVDVHPIDQHKPCFLGGIFIANTPGCAGHSDGDVIAHALCDALLSAAGAGDLGSVFGVDRPEYAHASGVQLLTEVTTIINHQGWALMNASVQFIGNTPHIAPVRASMQETLTRTCKGHVFVTATTTDGLGLTGRGEGRAAIANALLTPIT